MNMSTCTGRCDAAFWLWCVMQQATNTYQLKIATLLVGAKRTRSRGFGEVLCAFKGVRMSGLFGERVDIEKAVVTVMGGWDLGEPRTWVVPGD